MGKKNLRRILSNNVKHYRFVNNLTQEALAEKCELSTRYVSDIENEKGNIPVDTLEKLADALKVKPYLLVKEQNEERLPKRVNMRKESK